MRIPIPRCGVIALLGASALCAVAACADSDAAGDALNEGTDAPDDFGGGGSGQGPGTGGSGGSLPPEQELESSYESPVSTGRLVWVANPVSGRVALVDASSLEVRTVAAGHGPKYMAAIPDEARDVAVVINTLSQDATVLRSDPGGALITITLPLGAPANAWAVSSSGRWAIAWTNAASVTKPDPVQGFQDITVLDLTAGSEGASRLTVGYRPVAISFSSDESEAYAVTQDGVSVLDLGSPTGPLSSRLVPISTDPLEDSHARDVSITPDGNYAFVRRDGESYVTMVSLADGQIVEIGLPGPCTDLDLNADGSLAVAVIRETSHVVILPVPGVFFSPTAITLAHVTQATVGQVVIAASAPFALAYTNATQEERVTSIGLDSNPPTLKSHKLHGAVSSVFATPGGESAIVLHQALPSTADAFSVARFAPELPAKIVATLAPIQAVGITPTGEHAIVTETGAVHGAYLVRFENQQIDRYGLASPPIATGAVMSARRAYVAQEHPEGRITFIDLDTGLARTLTGFELGARVIDGSNP